MHRSLASLVMGLALLVQLAGSPGVIHAAGPEVAPPWEPVAGQPIAVVSVPLLNLREGPGTSYTVVTQLPAGTILAVAARNEAGDWLEVRAARQVSGWVSAELVQVLKTTHPQSADAALPTRIVAPSIHLDTGVVSSGWHDVKNVDGSISQEWDVPAFAAGWLVTSVRPGQVGNMVISGHHNIDGEVFRYVVDLNAGDPILVYAGDQPFVYQVTDKFIVADKYVSYQQRVENARWIGSFADERLTLVTCWPYTNNTHRVIVIAKPLSSDQTVAHEGTAASAAMLQIPRSSRSQPIAY